MERELSRDEILMIDSSHVYTISREEETNATKPTNNKFESEETGVGKMKTNATTTATTIYIITRRNT